MDILPHEIIEKICSLLPDQSKNACSLVCHSWYTMMIPFLYNTVNIHTYDTLNIFKRTVTSSQQTWELNNLVRRICFFNYGQTQDIAGRFIFHLSAIKFEEMVDYFPNIEYMVLHYESMWSFWQPFTMSDTVGKLHNISSLEYLTYFNKHTPKQVQIKILARNNRFHLCYGSINGVPRLFPYTATVTFLDQRPQSTFNVLRQILTTYPKIKSLKFITPYDADTALTEDLPQCSSLESLDLEICHIKFQHIQLISNTFINLSSLTLLVVNYIFDKATIHALFERRHDIKVSFEGYTAVQTKDAFYNFLTLTDSSGNMHGKKLHIMSCDQPLHFEFLQKDDGSRCIASSHSTIPDISYLFENTGQFIDDLRIDYFEDNLNLKMTNEVFPNLVKLDLSNNILHINSNDLPKVNSALDELKMDLTGFSQQDINAFSNVYPQLTQITLYFSEEFPKDCGYLDDETYNIHFPWASLHMIGLSDLDTLIDIFTVLVVKKRGDGQSNIWYYMSEDLMTGECVYYVENDVVDDDHISKIKRPSLVIHSSTIETVQSA